MKTIASVAQLGLRLLKIEVCVPRRFDLRALAIVSVCFGLLCVILSHLNTHWILVEVICLMLLMIGGLQMLGGPAKARQYSVLAGIGTMAMVGAVGGWFEPPESRSSGMLVFCNWTLIGPGAGYLGGVFVGGVFLIVDGVKRCCDGPAVPEHPAKDTPQPPAVEDRGEITWGIDRE